MAGQVWAVNSLGGYMYSRRPSVIVHGERLRGGIRDLGARLAFGSGPRDLVLFGGFHHTVAKLLKFGTKFVDRWKKFAFRQFWHFAVSFRSAGSDLGTRARRISVYTTDTVRSIWGVRVLEVLA